MENVALESLRWVDSELTTLCKTPLAMNEFHSKVVGGQKSQPKTVSTKGFTMTIISSELVLATRWPFLTTSFKASRKNNVASGLPEVLRGTEQASTKVKFL